MTTNDSKTPTLKPPLPPSRKRAAKFCKKKQNPPPSRATRAMKVRAEKRELKSRKLERKARLPGTIAIAAATAIQITTCDNCRVSNRQKVTAFVRTHFLIKLCHNFGPNTFVTRPFCLVESCMLDAAAMRVRSLFTSFTFCNIIFSCPVISKDLLSPAL